MKKIRLLKEDYKKDAQLFQAFIDGTILTEDTFFSGETIEIPVAPDFPIYIGRGSEAERKADFLKAFEVIRTSYAKLDREITFDERFWHSFLVTEKREYILENYPDATTSQSKFNNIVLKKFDWENYIYKCLVAVEYIEESSDHLLDKDQYYELVVNNLDVYNYIIKYPIFRNDAFLIKILSVIHKLDISSIMKAKIKGRDDLGKDERYGRRVIFEMNKGYPIMMAPLMDIETLTEECVKALAYYDVEVPTMVSTA